VRGPLFAPENSYRMCHDRYHTIDIDNCKIASSRPGPISTGELNAASISRFRSLAKDASAEEEPTS
jgi:hypothetical protein